jgi:predicted nucleic acid-binding protein
MSTVVLLDTSALLTLRDDEPGAVRVETFLNGPERCLACFLTRMKVLYRVWKDEGERAGRLAYEQLHGLPIHWIECAEPPLERAASLKACHPLSVADAWIAAAAQLAPGFRIGLVDPEATAVIAPAIFCSAPALLLAALARQRACPFRQPTHPPLHLLRRRSHPRLQKIATDRANGAQFGWRALTPGQQAGETWSAGYDAPSVVDGQGPTRSSSSQVLYNNLVRLSKLPWRPPIARPASPSRP